jgi:hypothetical protein
MAGGRALRQWFLYTTTTAPTGSDTVMILCAERHTGPDHRLPIGRAHFSDSAFRNAAIRHLTRLVARKGERMLEWETPSQTRTNGRDSIERERRSVLDSVKLESCPSLRSSTFGTSPSATRNWHWLRKSELPKAGVNGASLCR